MRIHNEETKKMMDDIADRLRLERINRGYSQEQFVEILEMSPRQYGRCKKNQKYLLVECSDSQVLE